MSEANSEHHGPAFALVVTGIVTQLAQILLVREMVVSLHGHELALGVFLASWLIWSGLGAALLQALPKVQPRTLMRWLLFAQALMLPAALLAARAAGPLASALAGHAALPATEPTLGVVAATAALLLAPIAPFGGAMFAAGARCLRQRIGELPGSSSAQAYGYEALGCAAGGALWLVALALPITALQLTGAVGLVAIIGATALPRASASFRTHALAAVFALFALSLCIWGAGWQQRLERYTWHHRAPGLKLVRTLDSPYARLTLMRSGDEFAVYANGRLAFSVGDREAAAPAVHLVMNQTNAGSRILLIGGFADGSLDELLLYDKLERLDVVEQDPAMAQLLTAVAPAHSSPELAMHGGCARRFVRRHEPASYDVVIVCGTSPDTLAANRLYTREFFAELKRIVAPGGIVCLSLGAQDNLLGGRLGRRNKRIVCALRAIFPNLRITPGGVHQIVAAANTTALTLDSTALAARYQDQSVQSPVFSPYHFDMLWPAEQSVLVAEHYSRHTDLAPNTDTQPTAYLDTIVADEAKRAGEHGPRLLDLLTTIRPTSPLIMLGCLFVLCMLWKRCSGTSARYAQTSVLWAAAAIGFTGLAWEVMILLAYQSHVGTVYVDLGLILAAFMVGAGLGPWLQQALPGRYNLRAHLMVGILCTVSLATLIAFANAIPVLWWVLTAAATGCGLWTGMGFATLTAFLPANQGAGNRVWTADMIGGALGALGATCCMIPAWGLLWTATFLVTILGLVAALVAESVSATQQS